jgi:hypothetical protein
MPDITFDYIPTTGAVLQPDGFNRDLYQQTSGKSLFETLNGNVTYPNLNAAFEVESHLIRPGQTGIARSDGRVFSADYFSDLWAGLNNDFYTPVGGACLSFRVPYDMSYALFSASVFLTVWRQFGPPNIEAEDPFSTRLEAPPVRIQMFYGDTNGIAYTRRELPQTVFFKDDGFPAADVGMVEQYTCHHYNLLHAKIAGKTAPNQQLTKGYATFGLAVYVSQNLNGNAAIPDPPYLLDLTFDGDNDARPASYYKGVQRVRTYVRNATVMGLL